MRMLPAMIVLCSSAGCAPHHAPVVFDMRPASLPAAPATTRGTDAESYAPVSGRSAEILGCRAAAKSPVCSVGLPTAEEDSAFLAEGNRLIAGTDARCRRLGEAIIVHEPQVRMYPEALQRTLDGERLYGLGHTYEINDVWLVRVARRIDDLNVRTLAEKLRTLRHEMSHTIGATETPVNGWTAEDYATRCG